MPAILHFSLLAGATAEPATSPISVQTALLVILGLGLLLAVKSLAGLHRRVDALTAAAQSSRTRSSATPAGAPQPEVLAVIAAAVFEVLGSDQRIVSISTAAQQGNSSWSQEGRRQVFAGRKVR